MSESLLIARERDFIKISGPESRSFLQGQLSQDIENLTEHSGAWSFLLDPTGLVVAWLRVICVEENGFILDMDPGFAEEVKDRLSRFLIRTKCLIEILKLSILTLIT